MPAIKDKTPDQYVLEDFTYLIGKMVRKKNKPFKSGLKVNTVQNIVVMDKLSDIKGYIVFGCTFFEDDSVVSCESVYDINGEGIYAVKLKSKDTKRLIEFNAPYPQDEYEALKKAQHLLTKYDDNMSESNINDLVIYQSFSA